MCYSPVNVWDNSSVYSASLLADFFGCSSFKDKLKDDGVTCCVIVNPEF